MDPNFEAEAEQLCDSLLCAPTITKERAAELIRSYLRTAYHVGKLAGIDVSLGVLRGAKPCG